MRADSRGARTMMHQSDLSEYARRCICSTLDPVTHLK